MVRQAFQQQSRQTSSYFDADELSKILSFYGETREVSQWFDYAIICADNRTTFVAMCSEGSVVASLGKTKNENYEVFNGAYSLTLDSFDKALSMLETDFGNKKTAAPSLRVV